MSTTSDRPAPDVSLARAFLSRLDPEAQHFTLQTYDDTKAKRKAVARIREVDPGNGALDVLAGWNRSQAGVFVTVNETDGHGRQTHNVQRVRAVFVDLDGAPLEPVLSAALEPHIVVQSSPGRYHAYWLVDDCPLDTFPAVQRALAAKFAGDPSVHDLPRVMRLPGFLHCKSEPFLTRMLEGVGFRGPPYALAEIVGTLALDLSPQAAARSPADGKIATGGRHAHLFARGRSMAKGGMSRAAVRAALVAENEARCDPPIDVADIDYLAERAFSAKDAASWDRTEGHRSHANDAGGAEGHADAQDAPQGDSGPAKGKRRASQEAGADTEDAIASLLVRDYRNTFRYATGLGWMHWRGDHWAQDDRLAYFDVARRLSRARGVQATDADNRRLGSAKFVNGVVTLARSDPRIVHGAAEFDADPLALNTPAGIVDLTTGTLRAHDHALVTKVTAVAPDFKASRAIWHSFLRDVFGDDIELVDFMRRLLGYLLTGATHEQILAFCFGTGANGKSTLLDLMMWLMGTYATKLPADALMARRGDRHPTEIALLKGIRLAVSNEIDEGEFWAESKLKELTGDQVLTARFMRMDFFTFNATHKHVIAGNHRPQIRAMDEAMRRRILLVPFNVRFEGSKRDRGLPAKLRSSGGAILADLIEGAAEWHRHGLGIPAVVRQASDEYATTMDSLGNWTAECCVVNQDADCKASLLYTSYCLWKRDRGEQPVSMTRWGEQMGSRGYAKVRNNGVRYRGIDLTGDAHDRAARVPQ